jgi:hypothetical protein
LLQAKQMRLITIRPSMLHRSFRCGVRLAQTSQWICGRIIGEWMDSAFVPKDIRTFPKVCSEQLALQSLIPVLVRA